MNIGALKSDAKRQLEGKWGIAVAFVAIIYVGSVLLGILVSRLQPIPDNPLESLEYLTSGPKLSNIITLIISGPLAFAGCRFFYRLINGQQLSLRILAEGFENFLSTFVLFLVVTVKIFLWSLLLVVPGIIASFRYSQAFYILQEDPSKGALAVIRESSEMMKGHKTDYFICMLSFIGWSILVALTLGLAGLYVWPYYHTTFANFYMKVSRG
jgi:uncharacterized membrane protein